MKSNQVTHVTKWSDALGFSTIVRYKKTTSDDEAYGIIVSFNGNPRVVNLTTGHITPASGFEEIRKHWERVHGTVLIKCADE